MRNIRILIKNIRDGFKNVIRNFSLSLASISCITVTLLIVAFAIVGSYNVENFTKVIRDDFTIVVYMNNSNTEETEAKIKNEINDMFNLEEINLGDFTYLSNSRQISLVKKAVEISKNLEDALNNDVPIDLLEIDIKEICEILGEIIGESYDDKLIDTLFSNFCLGK